MWGMGDHFRPSDEHDLMMQTHQPQSPDRDFSPTLSGQKLTTWDSPVF